MKNILSWLVTKGLNADVAGSSVSVDSSGVVFSYKPHNVIRISCGEVKLHPDYGLIDFEITLVKAKDHLERDSRLVFINDDRYGWIFPVNALVTRGELPDDKWCSLFANYALYALIFNECIYDTYAHLPSISENDEFLLTDFYDNDLAVVVLDKQKVRDYNISYSCIEIMLLRYGYATYYPQPDYLCQSLYDTSSARGNIRLKKVSQDILVHLDKYEPILRRAFLDEGSCSCFLSLYQLIESMLYMVFDVAVKLYATPEQCASSDPWLLRERLQEIANERWRLNCLVNRFVEPSIGGSVLRSLQSECCDFLSKYDLVSRLPDSPATALYAMRNLVIHGQVKLVSSAHMDLGLVNAALLELCYELISKFSLEKGRRALLEEFMPIAETPA